MTAANTNHSLAKPILLTWLLCGTLDALSAIVLNLNVPAAAIFKYIASGLFGKAAFAGGTEMVVYGVLFHYLIALVFTAALFLLYPFFIKVLRNKIVLALAYGVLIFAAMNFVVVPYLSHIVQKPMKLQGIVKNLSALIISFGFPISYIAGKYHKT